MTDNVQNFSHFYDTSKKFYDNLVRGTQAVTCREKDMSLFLMMMMWLVDYESWCIQTGIVYVENNDIRHIRLRNLGMGGGGGVKKGK